MDPRTAANVSVKAALEALAVAVIGALGARRDRRPEAGAGQGHSASRRQVECETWN